MQQNVNILWQQCANILRDNVTPSVYNTWFASLDPVEFTNNTLVLRVQSQFVASYIEENYIDLLGKTIRRVFGPETALEYRVLVDSTSGASTTYLSDGVMQVSAHAIPGQPVVQPNWQSHLNPNYTFSTFIQGETNKLARTVGVAISKEPGKTVFNPLFIYGSSGVGKTHLANAIGNQIQAANPDSRVLYVNANTFKLQFQEAVNQNKVQDFLLFYQNVDVLILDDVQFFSNLKGTQDTFFHIFNYLHQMRKQLILTSDRSPVDLKDVEERLLTRFRWGLPVEIQRPDLNLRKAILIDKMHRDGISFSEDIVDYIATHACENIRDIEGVLASLIAYSTLMNQEIDMSLAQSIVERLVTKLDKPVSMQDVMGAVCEHIGVTEKVFVSRSRQRDVARARQMFVYIVKEMTDHTLSEIGACMSRDHATALYAFNTIKKQLQYDKVLHHELQTLMYELKH